MKFRDLGTTLRAAAQVPAWKSIERLCPLVDALANTSVQDFVRLARKKGINQPKQSGPLLREVAEALRGVSYAVAPIAKAAAVKDLDELSALFSSKGDVSIDAYVSSFVASASKREREKEKAPVDENQISAYVQRLERALGNEREFGAVFAELRSDQDMLQQHVVEVANRFMGRTPPSTSRSKALERILQRHTKLVKFKARAQGLSGKSAA